LEYETLKNGTRVYIDETIRFGFDALILSHFALSKQKQRILDLGCGCGILSLSALDRGHGNRFVMIDINEQAVFLANKGANEYRAEHPASLPIEVSRQDLKSFSYPSKFDVVICNPPYFSVHSGHLSRDILNMAARHELRCTIDDVAFAAHRNLKQGGSLCISYRPARLADAIIAMRNHRLEPKRMRFVRNDATQNPWLVLIEAHLDGGIGLDVVPDLIVQDDAGGFSAEMLSIVG